MIDPEMGKGQMLDGELCVIALPKRRPPTSFIRYGRGPMRSAAPNPHPNPQNTHNKIHVQMPPLLISQIGMFPSLLQFSNLYFENRRGMQNTKKGEEMGVNIWNG